MKVHPFRIIAIVAAAALVLGGCDTISGWFSSPSKSKLKGQRISIMATDETVKPDDTLKDVNVTLPAPYSNTEWPEPGGYADNAMYHLAATGPLQRVWEADAGEGSNSDSRLTAPPVITGGKIYVLDARARVFVFDAGSGEELWHRSVAPKGHTDLIYTLSFGLFGEDKSVDPTKGFGGGIAFDDGKLFATTGFGDVVALDGATGKELWRVNVGVPIFNAPVANGGRVFFSSQDNHFYALAESNGRTLWDHQGITESAGILESTSAAVAGEFVIAPYTSGELYALRVQNGRPAWTDMLTRSGNVTALTELDDIAGRPVIDRDLVFAISHSGVMAAIKLDSGDRLWTRDLGGIQTPWVAGDYLYVAGPAPLPHP
jgi:outer membrane protein assembly factor BamB